MAGESLQHKPLSEICLHPKEWEEVCGCSMALYAAIHNCEGLQGDESAELVKSVQMRLASAVHRVEVRLFGE